MLNKNKELNNMTTDEITTTKAKIYCEFKSHFIGYILLKQYQKKEKLLNKTDIKKLSQLCFNLYHSKQRMLDGMWDSGNLYAINKRTAVDCMGAYLGNNWSSFCNLNHKIDVLNICHEDYGQENVLVLLCDISLKKITKKMYIDLDNLYGQEVA
tara:strand:+ start:12 stop:473 length:462 start_codon:yes stop_codon:yes gene_type:complete